MDTLQSKITSSNDYPKEKNEQAPQPAPHDDSNEILYFSVNQDYK